MPKIAILEVSPRVSRRAIDAHLRNSIILADVLGAHLLVSEQQYKRALKSSYDVIIFSHSGFYAKINLMEELLRRNPNARRFWLSNEYNLTPNSFFTKRPYEIICNFNYDLTNRKNVEAVHVIDLSALIWREPNPLTFKKYDCLYFGTYRPGRAEYFKKYLQGDIYVSTNAKNFKRFIHIGCNPKFIKKLMWDKGRETLNLFKYSLYMEDPFTHEHFNFFSGRLYEALFCNVVQFFDTKCHYTIEKSGLDFRDEYFVEDHAQLMDKVNNMDWNVLYEHQKTWAEFARLKYAETVQQLREIIFCE